MLASQDVSGIEALWGRSGLVGQFTLRIALPKARRILAETNLAAETVPRYHAVVNADSGVAGANRIVRLPDAGDRHGLARAAGRLWHRRAARRRAAAALRRRRGAACCPRLPPAAAADARRTAPVALLGETIDVDGAPGDAARCAARPGATWRSSAPVPTRPARCWPRPARSLATQGPARFSVVCLDDDALPSAAALHAALPGRAVVRPGHGGRAAGARTVGRRPAALVLGYAWDARPAGGRPARRC